MREPAGVKLEKNCGCELAKLSAYLRDTLLNKRYLAKGTNKCLKHQYS
jgi:hypothetical protein